MKSIIHKKSILLITLLLVISGTVISFLFFDLWFVNRSTKDQVKGKHVYEFMNTAIFTFESSDRRELPKLDFRTIEYDPELKDFINSIDDSIISPRDKKYLIRHIVNKSLRWDRTKLSNVWCLTVTERRQTMVNNPEDHYGLEFMKHFGEGGLHSYSKPIFNRKRNIAIIEHHEYGGLLSASESILLFRKEAGKWILVREFYLMMA